ncbi:unnamed protein product [Cunninghamella echinulata]
MNLVTPTTKDSIGMKLLRKMGWKPGQGIGPRVLQYLDSQDDGDNDDKENETMISLAPRDTPIVEYKQKTNVYGLGYDLVAHVPQVAEMYRYQQLKKDQQYENEKRKGRMGFGVGIFEDEDEDEKMAYDDDNTTTTTARSYHHTLYDDDENEDDYTSSILMGSKRSRKSNINDNKDHLKKKRCSDGHLPLKGFHVATQSQTQELSRWFAPPQVPSHFDELHKSATVTATKATASRGELTMDARGELLGEKPIEPRSVFDYISAKSKEQLEKAKNKEKEPLLFINTSKLQVTLIPAQTAQLALKGYMPFSHQPEKHARYIHYLELCIQKSKTSSSAFDLEGGKNDEIEIDVPKGLTYEAGMKEINEFIQAARIYRPISSMMSNRFTSASTSLNDSQALNGQVEQISFEGGLKTEEQYRKERELKQQLIQDVPKPKLSQEVEAAAMGIFGPLTRKVKPFYPNRLLCKRFNVKNPHPDYVHQTPGHRTQAGSTNILNDQMMQSMFQQQQPQQQNIQMQKKQLPIGFSTVDENDPALKLIIDKPSMRKENEQMDSTLKEKGDEEKENDDEDKKLDYERPAMDIFKAIFENDDDSDDSDVDEEPHTNISTLSATSTNQWKENEYNVKEKDDDDSFIGPPIPPTLPLLSSPFKDDHISTESPTMTDIPFKPKFIKRDEQQATNTIISNEKIHVTTPFQPRLTSSKGPKRRHIQVSSDDESSSSSSSSEDDDDHERQRKRKHSHSSKKRHGHSDDNDDEKDRSHRHERRRRRSRKHDKKKKKKSRRYDDSDDSMDEHDKGRRRKKKKKDERDYSDNDKLDEKRSKKRRHTSSTTASSSSRHNSKQKDHHDIEKKLEDDLSLWVEKQPVSRRSRAEDLW